MMQYEARMICGGERDISLQCLLFPKHWQLLKWKKNYVFQLGQIIFVQIVALVHRNNQEFGILNALHQENIVSKGLFKKTFHEDI